VNKRDYLKVGGHAAVKDKILEHYFLAGEFLKYQIPIHCRVGLGAISFRMYPGGFRDLVDGWSKSFSRGAAGTPPFNLALTIAWISGALMACAHLIASFFSGNILAQGLASLFYCAFAFQNYRFLKKIGNFRIGNAIFYLIPLLFFLAIFTLSAVKTFIQKEVRWKGRTLRA